MQKIDATLINDKYAANFHPARFELIKHLYTKANAPEHRENQFLAEKAKASIDQYQADLEANREKANLILKTILLTFPECGEDAKTLFEECRFKQLEQLNTRLNVSRKAQQSSGKLTQLFVEMQVSTSIDVEPNQTEKLEALMLTQEQEARSQVGAALFSSNDNSSGQLELQSLKAAREAMKYFHIDKSIERAIEDFPKNAGPHNPHMLAITSLMNMRDLSPQYLRRFAGYIETVLWLEKSETKLNRKK